MPWRDAATIGNLLGTRMVLNEFIAFAQLGPLKDTLDPRSFTIATFALCGFANFSSIGIQIGGIGALVPERRHDLARLGLRAMLAGTLANFVSACIAAMLLCSAESEWRPTTSIDAVEAAEFLRGRGFGGADVGRGARLRTRRVRRRRWRTPFASPYARHSALAGRRASSATPGGWSAARCAAAASLALSGRVHFYEGHDLTTVTFAMRVLGRLGVPTRHPDQRGRRHQHRRSPRAR